MVLNKDETIDIEAIKQKFKIQILDIQEKMDEKEHVRKMNRLNKILEIVKAGGKEIKIE